MIQTVRVLLFLLVFPLIAAAQIKPIKTCWVDFEAQRYDESIACAEKVMSQWKNTCYECYYLKGYALYEKGEYEASRAVLEEALAMRSGFADTNDWEVGNTFFLLAKIDEIDGDMDAAVNHFIDATEHVRGASIYLTIAFVYARIGRYEESVELATKAIEIDNKSDKAYNNRALAYLRMGAFKEAKKDLKKALKLNPENPYVYKHYGYYYLELGDKQKACEQFQIAIDKGYRTYISNEATNQEVDELIKENCGD